MGCFSFPSCASADLKVPLQLHHTCPDIRDRFMEKEQATDGDISLQGGMQKCRQGMNLGFHGSSKEHRNSPGTRWVVRKPDSQGFRHTFHKQTEVRGWCSQTEPCWNMEGRGFLSKASLVTEGSNFQGKSQQRVQRRDRVEGLERPHAGARAG